MAQYFDVSAELISPMRVALRASAMMPGGAKPGENFALCCASGRIAGNRLFAEAECRLLFPLDIATDGSDTVTGEIVVHDLDSPVLDHGLKFGLVELAMIDRPNTSVEPLSVGSRPTSTTH